jgi:hypothetical protein
MAPHGTPSSWKRHSEPVPTRKDHVDYSMATKMSLGWISCRNCCLAGRRLDDLINACQLSRLSLVACVSEPLAYCGWATSEANVSNASAVVK